MTESREGQLVAKKYRLVRDLSDKNFLMLKNHGLLTVGKSPADAFRCFNKGIETTRRYT